MTILILIFLVIIISLASSYYAYRICFYSPSRDSKVLYKLPEGEQYEPKLDNIKGWIEEILELPHENIFIQSYDGKKLYGRYYHTLDNAPVQIMFHGYRSSAYLDFCGGIKFARKCGCNAIVVDQRSHGKSEGNTISFGIQEKKDCISWINYVNQRFGTETKIILSGLSMGASTVLMTANLKLPENVVGIVADCPYSSPKEIISLVCERDMKLPAKLVYPFVKLGARIFGHFDLEEWDPIRAVADSKLPILIFHGDSDLFVPCDMSKRLKESCPEMVRLEIVPDAGHGLAYVVGPKQYETSMLEFMESILN